MYRSERRDVVWSTHGRVNDQQPTWIGEGLQKWVVLRMLGAYANGYIVTCPGHAPQPQCAH